MSMDRAVGPGDRFRTVLGESFPPLLHGIRLSASVILALATAYWLELDNAFWAGTSAGIVCQPSLGASLRKGWFRAIGTAVGAIFIVALTGLFPQDRVGFLIGLIQQVGTTSLLIPEPGIVLGLRYCGSATQLEDGTARRLPDATLTGLRGKARRMRTSAGGGPYVVEAAYPLSEDRRQTTDDR